MNLFFPNKVYHHNELPDLAQQLLQQPQQWLQEFAQVIIDWNDDREYMTAQTSGSTGIPQTIKLSKEAMKQSALKTAQYFDLQKGAHVLAALPYSFIAGKMMVIRSLVLNWNFHIVPPRANPISDLEDELDFVAMTPHQLSTVLAQSSWKLGMVKKLLLGGAPVSPTLMNQIQSLNTEIYLGYGMTETITHIAVKRINGKSEQVFSALEGVRFSQSESGTLTIHADHLNEAIETTDIIKLIKPDQFEWLGRADNVINSGGVKIHPEILEQKISAAFDSAFFISSRPSEMYGEEVILLIEGESKNKEEVFDKLSLYLSKLELPKAIFFVPSFEYTETGKVRRKETIRKTLNQ